jgi:hypothetical protein
VGTWCVWMRQVNWKCGVCRSNVMSNVYIEVHCSGNCVKLIGSVSSMFICRVKMRGTSGTLGGAPDKLTS